MKIIQELIKPIKVFTILKILHLIMKLFGFFPFKIKLTNTGPKCVICVWGLILTIIHFLTYFCGYFMVLVKLHSKQHIIKSPISSSIGDMFGMKFALYIEGITIAILFANIVITKKAQKNILKLFYKSDVLLIMKWFKLQIFLYSFILLLNLLIGFMVSVTVYVSYKAASTDAIIYLMVRILPHFYVLIKISQFVIYISILNFGFNSLYSKGVEIKK